MRTRWLLALLAAGCFPSVNPDQGRYACAAAADCGPGWECRPQVTGGGLCFKAGTCQDVEPCNGVDDDCNGAVDDAFDLTSDSAHCGACDRACGAGTRCLASACREAACDDGLDNDADGGADCADPACLSQRCGPDGGRCALRTADGGLADGGVDAGDPLAPGCFSE